MSMTDRSRQRVPGRLVALVAFLLVVIPPAIAYAGTQITYATGTAGVGGTFKVGNFTGRDYNQVWHQSGKTWTVLYHLTDGSAVAIVTDSSNPTRWPNHIGYADAWCNNVNDNSFVTWTCQTTH
jgi:hypothetical protein